MKRMPVENGARADAFIRYFFSFSSRLFFFDPFVLCFVSFYLLAFFFFYLAFYENKNIMKTKIGPPPPKFDALYVLAVSHYKDNCASISSPEWLDINFFKKI
jgi:hypothetical protein